MKRYFLVAVPAAVIFIVFMMGHSLIAQNNKAKSRDKELKEYEATLELVKNINQNSDFGGLELLNFSDKTEENQQSQGASDIAPEYEEAAEGGVRGYYFNYPKDGNDGRLTQISITIAPYHIYSITTGQNISEIIPVLEKKGFTLFDKNTIYEGRDIISYRQHHVSIILDVNKDTRVIRTITVSIYDKEDTRVY